MSRILKIVLPAFLAALALSWGLQELDRMPGTAGRVEPPPDGPEPVAPSPPRVICMSPAVTEIVFALGAGDRVVAVSQFVTYPPEALEKPVCGGFINPNKERILMLEADLIIMQGLGKDLSDFAARNEIRLLSVRLTDLDAIFGAIGRIGAALRRESAAELLCAEMRLSIARAKAAVEGRPRPNVFLVIGREPGTLSRLYTTGSGGYLNDLIEVAGGRNIFRDIERDYSIIDKEALLERKPDVIVELHGDGMGRESLPQVRQVWASQDSLPAVQQNRIYVIEGTYTLVPGPRLVRLAEELARLFHPDLGE